MVLSVLYSSIAPVQLMVLYFITGLFMGIAGAFLVIKQQYINSSGNMIIYIDADMLKFLVKLIYAIVLLILQVNINDNIPSIIRMVLT